MARPITLFTGQFADLPLEELADKAKSFGYDGVELACWGDHFDVNAAMKDASYCKGKWELLKKKGLGVWAISNHLVGQAVCDNIDKRHASILSPSIFGDGDPEGVRKRAAEEMKTTARAARKLADVVGHEIVVCGFTGSSIWHLLYSFPPVSPDMIDAGYKDFADRWNPILDVFDAVGVKFALEAQPTEIAFDAYSAMRAVEALGWRKAFGFNYNPSHFGYQGVDYVEFIHMFGDRIYHVHMKDVGWSSVPKLAGVFGGHTNFGDVNRYWDFRSLGRGNINFEEIIRMLNRINYQGPLSIEWEDSGMDRWFGIKNAIEFLRRLCFPPSSTAFDRAFERK
ncbi:MAG: sugar phosphate isomerase/epimerase [Candidatus Pacebacteria bacterium]|nr:sugar phosphate isomerase/epimerase [Candidatus Paceibacterota bacterium]